MIAWLLNVFNIRQEGYTHEDDMIFRLLDVRRLIGDSLVDTLTITHSWMVPPPGNPMSSSGSNLPVCIDDIDRNSRLELTSAG